LAGHRKARGMNGCQTQFEGAEEETTVSRLIALSSSVPFLFFIFILFIFISHHVKIKSGILPAIGTISSTGVPGVANKQEELLLWSWVNHVHSDICLIISTFLSTSCIGPSYRLLSLLFFYLFILGEGRYRPGLEWAMFNNVGAGSGPSPTFNIRGYGTERTGIIV